MSVVAELTSYDLTKMYSNFGADHILRRASSSESSRRQLCRPSLLQERSIDFLRDYAGDDCCCHPSHMLQDMVRAPC